MQITPLPDFNFEAATADDVTRETLLRWIGNIHTELTNCGLLPGDDNGISDQTHQELMILAKMADALEGR